MISLITPTEGREAYLQLLYKVVQAQTVKEWEWLIHDTYYKPSPFFSNLSDPRVRYTFSKEVLSIGAKRNALCEQAQGEIILHFDDDDYYAPTYAQKMQEELKQADFFHFEGWYCFDVVGKMLYYSAPQKETSSHFFHDPLASHNVQEIPVDDLDPKGPFFKKLKEGYGFAYGYKKKVWEKGPFEPITHGEDLSFFTRAQKEGFKMALSPDHSGYVLHMLHDKNTSRAFPQYRLPPFLLPKLFPHITPYLQAYPQ